MRVWLMHVSEELPIDDSARTFRYGYLAAALEAQGHTVLRWAPTFRHRTKQHRFASDHRVRVTPGYEIQFVYSPGYRRHIGLKRLHTYRVLARRFKELATREPPPDLIVAAIPSLEWAESAVEFGQARGISVVIDIRDIWPDIYLNALPRFARPFGRRLLAPQFRRVGRICRGATMLTGVSESYLQWALGWAGRPQTELDVVLPLGFELTPQSTATREEHLRRLAARGIDISRPICVFAGRFERSYDLATVIEAARVMAAKGESTLQFVFCGGGSRAAAYERQAHGLANVHFVGWIDGATLQTLSEAASIGLCAYAPDATQSVPNKPFEYMASRLAVVSSLPGDMDAMLTRHNCGITYPAGDSTALARVLSALVRDPARLARLQANGHAAWQESYESRVIYPRFVTHLGSLVKPAAQAA